MKKTGILIAFAASVGLAFASGGGKNIVQTAKDSSRCLAWTVKSVSEICPYMSKIEEGAECPYLSSIPEDTKCPYLKSLKEGKNTGKLTGNVPELTPSLAETSPWLFVKAPDANGEKEDRV